ncbi:M14-type cytosolic carboxypeptidase [Microbulbifer epialgicus]|uniref:M14-type cytosolic carboxypeptidase n=1 Tax=Microbulbifer epialgicus TaxID=393907 RepID=A0ABV4P6H1_9GAMM
MEWNFKNYFRIVGLCIFFAGVLSVSGTAFSAQFSENFESGSIGSIERVDDLQWNLWIKNDSDEPWLDDIPRWRNWWFVKMRKVPKGRWVTLNIKDIYPSDNRGWEYSYVPVYSYDNVNWQRFDSKDVTQSFNDNVEDNTRTHTLSISARFEHKTVWIARFYPYTTKHFDRYLRDLRNTYPWLDTLNTLTVENLGVSPHYQQDIKLLTLTDTTVADSDKTRVWIHARTHPAETGGSFVVEGLVDFLSSAMNANAESALAQIIFNIVAVHNVDGVIDGNYRTNMETINLESAWLHYPESPYELSQDAPFENRLLNDKIRELSDAGPRFGMALNLHSSQSTPDYRTFFYPHFGTIEQGYSPQQAQLWNDQLRFIQHFSQFLGTYHGNPLVEPTVEEGGSAFLNYFFPETWWWNNFNASVLALTMETTYDRAGYGERRITPDDLRKQGHALGLAIMEHFKIPVVNPPIFYPDNGVVAAPLLLNVDDVTTGDQRRDQNEAALNEIENRL